MESEIDWRAEWCRVEQYGYDVALGQFISGQPTSSCAELTAEYQRRFKWPKQSLAQNSTHSPSSLLTPYELGVLLHYEVPIKLPLPHGDAADAARRKLGPADLGLLAVVVTPPCWQLSPRGRAYIASLLRVPLPAAVWVTQWPEK